MNKRETIRTLLQTALGTGLGAGAGYGLDYLLQPVQVEQRMNTSLINTALGGLLGGAVAYRRSPGLTFDFRKRIPESRRLPESSEPPIPPIHLIPF